MSTMTTEAGNPMKRSTTKFVLPPSNIGTRSNVLIHEYFPSEEVKNLDRNSLEWYAQDRIYIQSSLHADELPGLLVSHHLIKMIDKAAERGGIKKHIAIVPFANPIGLNQILQSKHMGRFSFATGINFNRNWMDVTDSVAKSIEGKLDKEDKQKNTALIRKSLFDEASAVHSNKSEVTWKKELFKRACISNVVLDLHCDSEAVLHTYTHDRLWPAMADLTASLDSHCNLIAPESGGNPFDEAFSCPWAKLQDKFGHQFPIDMACQSVTVELRGECDVSDELAIKDAQNLYAFLTRRGYISDDSIPATIDTASQQALPLNGVDMIEATHPGILAWKVGAGDKVSEGQLLGEIVNIENIDAPRVPIHAKTSGIIFGMHANKLAVPGDIVIKVAGNHSLDYRKGNLLTAK